MNSTSLYQVAIAGVTGRMGHMLVEAILNSPDLQLSGALTLSGDAALGQDAGAFAGRNSGIVITDKTDLALQETRCLIDFTRPEGTLSWLAACREQGVSMVIGTTGFDAEQKAQISAAAQDIPIVLAPNMSVGVNVTMKLLELAARALSEDYDIEIIESHHRHKVDAPSGTALQMGEIIAAAQGRKLQDCAVFGRHGHTGERVSGSIGFSAIRAGDIVGDHTALFAGSGERIEISHIATSRAGYAQGSLQAVRFLQDKAQGLFDMFDVLGLR